MTSPPDDTRRTAPETPAIDLFPVRVFVAATVALLAGYMFLGRGFAHLGVPPVYLGEVVLLLGLLAVTAAFVRRKLRVAPSRIVWVLLLFMALGVARTVPYLGQDGANALRDATLWGYALFALMVYALADRRWVLGALRAYSWIVPLFALWLPIAFTLFTQAVDSIPIVPGSDLPILYFKNQDMAVHAAGSIALLVVGTPVVRGRFADLWRFAISIPLAWALFVTVSYSRGALGAVLVGLLVLGLFTYRSRAWLPVISAAILVGVVQFTSLGGLLLGPSPIPSAQPSAVVTPGPSASTPTPTPTIGPSPAPTPVPTVGGRTVSPGQWITNILSVVVPSSNATLEGTKNFRLAWWSKIIDYTVAGPYFWTGKGFGINLADDDGFQPTADHSLRTPHNATFDVLARMGVPGLVLWLVLQVGFLIALVRSILAHRRAGDQAILAVGIWVLVYWITIMVNASFDPYLEGPQGGIWFWALFGLGLVIIRLTPRRLGT